MLPYFINLNNRLISDDETNDIRDFAFTHIDKFINHNYDGNYNFSTISMLKNNIPAIGELERRFKIRTKLALLCHLPKTEVIKHIDSSFSRNTVLMIPINPLGNYPPGYFWNTLEDTDPISICDFANNSAILFNTRKIHSVINDSDKHRLNLQFSFYEDIETVYKLYSNGDLLE